MHPNALVRLAVLGEGLLVLLAVAWAGWREFPLTAGAVWEGVLVGCGAAAVLAALNFYLLCGAPAIPPVRSVRRLYRQALKPIFSGVTVLQALVIGLAAGLGEELFFRGVLQTELGLPAASLIFGALHTGGRGTLAFGGWVALLGAFLGVLMQWTGGLTAPVVAHGVYDAAALLYIRSATDCVAVTAEGVETWTGRQ